MGNRIGRRSVVGGGLGLAAAAATRPWAAAQGTPEGTPAASPVTEVVAPVVNTAVGGEVRYSIV